VSIPRMSRVDIASRGDTVTRSPSQEEIDGAIVLSVVLHELTLRDGRDASWTTAAWRPRLLQKTTRKHMKGPNTVAEKQTADMAIDACTVMNLTNRILELK
jgi:hypothetical protein